MGYLAAWKVLEEMIADFRKKGVSISAEIMNDLRSAKTLINILKADPSYTETSKKIEEYLLKVESRLISEGQRLFGVDYVQEWLKRLDEAVGKPFEEEEKATRFVHGVPKGYKWVRVKPSAELPIEKLETLAKESNLSYKVQNDGCLLVYGEAESMKDFIKKMTTKHGLKTEK
jgi:hypothetical protein